MLPVFLLALGLALTWLYLVTARARVRISSLFESFDTRLLPDRWPSISVIVEARQQGDVLKFTLPSILSFYYPQVEILLVDDGSDDAIRQAAQQAAAAEPAARFRVLAGAPTPPGWRDELWALEQGVNASDGEWLLFVDAGILFDPTLPRDLARLALVEDYSMASLLHMLRPETFWDRLLLPAFFFFFHFLYPFHRVRESESSIAAAAAGCLLVERQALGRAGGLQAVRGARFEELALGRLMKASGARVYLGASVRAAGFRRLRTLRAIRQMVTRSACAEFHYSWALVGASLVVLGFLFGLPVAGAVLIGTGAFASFPYLHHCALGVLVGAIWGMMILSYGPILRFYGLPGHWALTLPAAALLYGAMTVESAWLYRRRADPSGVALQSTAQR